MKRKISFFSDKNLSENKQAPWVDTFTPETVEELAVHKKKIGEVELWLHSCFQQQERNRVTPILLLTGPPGAGKTSTVKVLSKKLRAELLVWSNNWQEDPKSNFEFINSDFNSYNFRDGGSKQNQASAFSSFLLRSSKYSLFLDNKRILLFEEFPNAFLRDASSFHNIIKKYALCGRCPAVFIISDSVKGESAESNLFPKEFQLSLNITNISFNPIAPTVMVKVLTQVNTKVTSACRKLDKAQIEALAADSMGDIRNAINSLQFMCMSQTTKSKLTSQTKHKKCDQSEAQDLKRDSSLFLFHALGKILYCKRDASSKTERDVLPMHMKHLERDPPLSNAEEVYEKTSISGSGFCLFLQENYIPFIKDIETAANCSLWMSGADVLSAYWNGTDVMNDYAVSLATRGLMFNITYSATGNRWRPLHKPQFYDNNSKKNQALKTLSGAFKEKGLTLHELETDLIPYLSKLNLNSLTTEQRMLVKEIGEMKVTKHLRTFSKTLQEKDVFEIEVEEIKNESAISENSNSQEVNLPLSDEEIIIEEYDF
ncbi:cell cycle checkpoint protein RAD17-like [Uloborus diversus]|uniref:cell cycle checkpoint protein RAD17-like n=1 Tax=Uloborus diversus TaxID=327109 RepID=UPI00240A204E|nr:cell cycle checkpoint protein RAD17-like [Uloborus diversus]